MPHAGRLQVAAGSSNGTAAVAVGAHTRRRQHPHRTPPRANPNKQAVPPQPPATATYRVGGFFVPLVATSCTIQPPPVSLTDLMSEKRCTAAAARRTHAATTAHTHPIQPNAEKNVDTGAPKGTRPTVESEPPLGDAGTRRAAPAPEQPPPQ